MHRRREFAYGRARRSVAFGKRACARPGLLLARSIPMRTGIVTRNRPETLARTVAKRREAMPRTEVFVVDDSDDDDAEVTCEAVRGTQARVVSRRERSLCVEAMQSEALGYALLGRSTTTTSVGTARNTLLLCAAGEWLFATDDDFASEARTHRGSSHFGAEADDVCATETFASMDALHGALDLEVRTLLEWIQWATDTSAPTETVAYTFGAFGEPAFGQAAYLLLGAPARQWVNEPEVYEAALDGAPMYRAAPAITRHRKGQGMAGACLINLGEIVPPFLPTGVNEDGLFFATLQAIYPTRRIAALPVALEHAGGRRRAFSVDDIVGFASRWRTADILVSLVKGCTPDARIVCPRERLMHIGAALRGLGQRPDLTHLLTHLWQARCRNTTKMVERQLARAPKATRVFEHLEQLRHACLAQANTVPPTPVDLEEDGFGVLLGRFGDLMAAWPALWDDAHARLGGFFGQRQSCT
jgi:hypothetical protein